MSTPTMNKERQRFHINEVFTPCDAPCHGPIPDQIYCLISRDWWMKWRKYVESEENSSIPSPGPIDNSHLLDSDGDVKIEIDPYCGIGFGAAPFVFVPQTVWDFFSEWYGGGPSIDRQCIHLPRSNRTFVETRKLRLGIVWSKEPDRVLARRYSRSMPIPQFLEDMQKEMGFDPKRIRLIDFFNFSHRAIEPELWGKTLDEVQINSNQQQYILIEEMDKDGKWPDEETFSGLTRFPIFEDIPGTDRRPKFTDFKSDS